MKGDRQMNRYEKFCEELFPDLYKIAYLITGDSSAASGLAVNAVVQGVRRQRSMKNLADARFELMRILYEACRQNPFIPSKDVIFAALDHSDRCIVVFRHCSGLRFQDFCRLTGWNEEQTRILLSKISAARPSHQ